MMSDSSEAPPNVVGNFWRALVGGQWSVDAAWCDYTRASDAPDDIHFIFVTEANNVVCTQRHGAVSCFQTISIKSPSQRRLCIEARNGSRKALPS